MANESSPYYRYDPESLSWLHRRDEDDSEILSADVVRIIKANPELVTDAILRDYVVRGLETGLKAKRGPSLLRFTEEYLFSSASLAGGVTVMR